MQKLNTRNIKHRKNICVSNEPCVDEYKTPVESPLSDRCFYMKLHTANAVLASELIHELGMAHLNMKTASTKEKGELIYV